MGWPREQLEATLDALTEDAPADGQVIIGQEMAHGADDEQEMAPQEGR